MTERTHTPSGEVQAQLDALAMPICPCPADAAGQPCFRVVPVAGERCVPCQGVEPYHGPGRLHGYSGGQPAPAQMPLDALRTAVQPPVVPETQQNAYTAGEPCPRCGRPTYFGRWTQCGSPNLPVLADDRPKLAPDRPQLAVCTRCGARPTFYGTCAVCNLRAGELRGATTFQMARMRDRIFGGAGE
jgi:ribosomal protein L37E